MGVTQTECELLRSAAPKSAVMECQLSAASQGLLELFVGKWREWGCVCRDVNVREAQSETFLFIVTVYGMRKSSAHTHTHTVLCSFTAEIHEGNTCICKQALWDGDCPSCGEVFTLISSSLLPFFLPITATCYLVNEAFLFSNCSWLAL